MTFNHVLLTRFNIPTAGREQSIRANTGWLDERFELFERFCLPTVRSQTAKHFKWILYFDVETPEKYKTRIKRLISPLGCARVRYGGPDDFSLDSIKEDVLSSGASRSEWVITTRLDNDDAIARDYMGRILAAAQPRREVLNVPRGVIWRDGYIYSHAHMSNAFASLVEPPDGLETILSISHINLSQIAPIRQLDGPFGWMQVVHDRNVSNRVRGRMITPDRVTELFGLDSEVEIKPVSSVALAADNWFRGPLRAARDLGISAAKKVVRR